MRHEPLELDRPVVTFTGSHPDGIGRSELIREAKDAGWSVAKRAHPAVQVVVAADPSSGSRKLRYAETFAPEVLSYADWPARRDDPPPPPMRMPPTPVRLDDGTHVASGRP